MESFNLLNKLDQVSAPIGFEQGVLAELRLKKERKPQMARALRYSLAGLAAGVLAGVIGLNVFVLQKGGPSRLADRGRGAGTEVREVISITEAVDYSHEIRSVSHEPETVYILEQVSDVINTEIIY
ncbi:MAG: hypothetical protein WCC06_07235 [Candidatus Aminicenantales bacterium]